MEAWEGNERGQRLQALRIQLTVVGIWLLSAAPPLGWSGLIFLGALAPMAATIFVTAVILLFLGRNVFGPQHGRNVILAIALLVVSVGAIMLSVAVLPATMAEVALGRDPRGPLRVFDSFLAVVVLGAIGSLSTVLLTYSLQSTVGRSLLWAGYAASIVILVAFALLVSAILHDAVALGPSGPPTEVEEDLQLLEVVALRAAVVPTVLLAVGLLSGWYKIFLREIPDYTYMARDEATEGHRVTPVGLDVCAVCGGALSTRARPCPTCGATPKL